MDAERKVFRARLYPVAGVFLFAMLAYFAVKTVAQMSTGELPMIDGVFFLVFLAALAVLFYRVVTSALIIDGDRLIVRNYLRTHEISRARFAAVELVPGNAPGPNGNQLVVRIRTTDGRAIKSSGAVDDIFQLASGTPLSDVVVREVLGWSQRMSPNDPRLEPLVAQVTAARSGDRRSGRS